MAGLNRPTVELRPSQEFAIPEIVRNFEAGAGVVILHAPTGSGKSLIAGDLLRRMDRRAFITTPQRSLVDQYAADPRFRIVAPLHVTMTGKANYECRRARLALDAAGRKNDPALDASEAVCFELNGTEIVKSAETGRPISCRHKRWDVEAGSYPDCPYYRKKAEAEMAPTVVSTLAYFVYGVSEDHAEEYRPVPGWLGGRLSSRPLLIVDEAHGLESEMIRYLTSSWSEMKFNDPVYEKAWEEWVGSSEAKPILNRIDATDEEAAVAIDSFLDRMGNALKEARLDDSMDRQKFASRFDQALDSVRTVPDDLRSEVPWVVRLLNRHSRRMGRDIPFLDLTPVIAAPHLRRRLWSRAEKVLLMSGWFFGSKETLTEVGIADRRAFEVIVRSEFPPENGPIYRVPIVRLNHTNKAIEFPKILAAVDRLLGIETGRGVIHTQSFENVRLVAEALSPENRKRLWLHEVSDDFDREEFIREFKETSEPGSVLVSPSVTEGLDLPGELGEWCVFLKCPYASRGDERVARRMKMPDGHQWYERKAIEKTIQGRGRILRSATDTGRTYLLDLAHIYLLERWWESLPDWFRQPIEIGNRTLLDTDLRKRIAGE